MRPLLVLFLVAHSGLLLAKPTPPKTVSDTDGLKVTSQFDRGKGFELKLNGKSIYKFEDPTGGGPHFVLQSHFANEPQFLGVLEIYQADGCPAMNVLVAVYSSKEVKVSEPLGNCQGPKRATITDDKVEIEYAERTATPGGPAGMSAGTWVFENKALKKL